MSPTPRTPVIDARPRGPRGPLALEPVLGRSVLDRLVEQVETLAGRPGPAVAVLVERSGDGLNETLDGHPQLRVVDSGEPPADAWVVRTDRLYDGRKLRSAFARGADPETAAYWRLDAPHGLAGAGDELTRRQSFQPLGSYWARRPARALAALLAPTRVRPNAVTLAAFACFCGSVCLVALAAPSWPACLAAAAGLAVALVLDTADGHLARLQGTSSAFGRWLDGWLDEVADMLLHGAIAWAAYVRTGVPGWLVLGTAYAMGKYVFVAATTGDSDGAASAAPTTKPAADSLPARCVRMAGHADVRWHLWIVLAALGRLDAALAAYAAYYPLRALVVAGRRAVRRA